MDPVFARLYDFKDFFQPVRSSRIRLQGAARLETTIVDREKNRREKGRFVLPVKWTIYKDTQLVVIGSLNLRRV